MNHSDISVHKLTRLLLLQADTLSPHHKKDLTTLLAEGCTDDWLRSRALSDVCFTIACLYRLDKTLLRGEQFALIAKRLVAAEVKPGGPYRNQEQMIRLNIAVAYLFSCMGKRLDSCEMFLKMAAKDTSLSLHDPLLAFAVQSLSLTDTRSHEPTQPSIFSNNDFDGVKHAVYAIVHRDLGTMPETIRRTAFTIAEQVEKNDTQSEISCIGRMAYLSMPSNNAQSSVMNKKLHHYGIANVYCWMAYMLYDGLIDTQSSIIDLPVAGIYMRKAYDIYLAQNQNPESMALIRQAFDHADQANAWEITNAKARIIHSGQLIQMPPLPYYGDNVVIADRSMPHVLSPLLITLELSAKNSEQATIYRRAWEQYLIAKQLNDDVHDWKSDLRSGSLSPVVCDILRRLSVQPGTYKLCDLVHPAKKTFMQDTMQAISTQILQHITLSRHHFERSLLCVQGSPVRLLLDRLETSTLQGIRMHQDHDSFSRAYDTTTA